jgi:tyrosyl-tRNA synthetase
LTTPLLTTASGAKMGKTAAGAVWLNADMLPAYDYWQYWRNTEDRDVGRFLKLFTTLPLDEIARLEALGRMPRSTRRRRCSPRRRPPCCTRREAALAAAETARKTFEEGVTTDTLPTIEIAKAEVDAGLGVLTAFVKAGLVPSTGEARRQVKGGGLRVNDAPVTDERATLGVEAFADGAVKLSFGRKKHVLLRVVD